jgi:Sulfotransferase domain
VGERIQPDQFVIIIGSMKCGTSSLFDYLSQHPAMCASSRKETEYFSENQKHRVSVARYEDFWPNFDPAVHRYALEGSTGYTKWPLEQGVAHRMHAYGIRPKMIYLVRDPIQRIESHVNFIRINSRQRIFFEDQYPINVTRYASQLDPFVDAFGREAIRVVDSARLFKDPNEVCGQLYEWLKLPPHTIDEPKVKNVTANQKSSHLDRVIRNSRFLRRIALRIPDSVTQPVKNGARKLIPYRHERVQLSPERVREVRELLQEDVERLAREWGVDITSWGFDKVG